MEKAHNKSVDLGVNASTPFCVGCHGVMYGAYAFATYTDWVSGRKSKVCTTRTFRAAAFASAALTYCTPQHFSIAKLQQASEDIDGTTFDEVNTQSAAAVFVHWPVVASPKVSKGLCKGGW